MSRFSALLGSFFIAIPCVGSADIATSAIDFSKSYRACFAMTESAEDRAVCYDALIPKVIGLTASVTKEVQTGCKIEDWNYSRKAKSAYITGSTTCESGRLNYRLYDGEKFLSSGFTYIKGFAFQAFADVPSIAEMNIKYTIE